MTLLLIVLLPFLGSVVPLLVARRGRSACAWAAAALAALSLALLLARAPAVLAGETLAARVRWVPALGLDLVVRLDGYSWLFAVLVFGIGLLVVLYANYYLGDDDPPGRFFASLLLFMGAMGGLVLSGNLLQLALFWELTSLSSFLLIGYWQHRSDARRGARMALVVTGLGGLALLGGVLLVGRIVGSLDLDVVLASRATIVAHPLYRPALVLVLLGAFTKSAQVPFHFWLPQAMAAPTPVSAYLHSATMVKAGVFLLGRLYPALAGTPEWFVLVSGTGAVTLLLGAYVALFKDDLKGLLAYSTVSQLGLITLLFGFGTPLAPVAAVFHILNHATFKASLFMAAGIIDHEAGTRDMRVLNGLLRRMPFTSLLAIVAAAAMAGVPLLNGFLSKEMFFAEVLEVRWRGIGYWAAPAAATLAGVFSVAYAARFIYSVFIRGDGTGMPKAPHEPPRFMRAPVDVLVILCVVVGVAPAVVVGPLLTVAAAAVTGSAVPAVELRVWHGFNVPLAMSAVALVGGALAYAGRRRLRRMHARLLPQVEGRDVYDAVVRGSVAGARRLSTLLETGSLQRYAAFLLGTAAVVIGASLLGGGTLRGPEALVAMDAASAAAWVMMAVAAVGAVALRRRRFTALVLMSVVGLVVALAFVRLAAPDLALTQVLVEVVTTVLVMLALHFMPQQPPAGRGVARRVRDGAIALAVGGGAAALAWAVMTRPAGGVADYYLAQSRPLGGGGNVVNVILVDFRGFDTLGEITVLGIAGLGIYTMLQGIGHQVVTHERPFARDRYPVVLTQLTRALLPFALGIAAYLLLRGHNQPGGGFVAGLLTAVALILQFVSSGIRWTESRLRIDFRTVIATGVLIALLSGLVPWAVGAPFMDQGFTHVHLPLVGDVELASAMVFDFGVYVAVVGAVMVMLEQLGRLLEGGPEDPARRREGDPWKP